MLGQLLQRYLTLATAGAVRALCCLRAGNDSERGHADLPKWLAGERRRLRACGICGRCAGAGTAIAALCVRGTHLQPRPVFVYEGLAAISAVPKRAIRYIDFTRTVKRGTRKAGVLSLVRAARRIQGQIYGGGAG